jgi:membrane protein implicated in regulation of membrane protease activity
MIYGRSPRQLLVVWVVSALLMALIYWLELNAPALHELLLPFYWIIAAVAIYISWRWQRARSRKDRRGGDRRHADRRNHVDLTSSSGPSEQNPGASTHHEQ